MCSSDLSSFPTPPLYLNDLDVDLETGILYVSDSGNQQGENGAVYRISPQGGVSLILDKKRFPALHTPNGLLLDGAHHLLLADFGTGMLYRIKLADSSVETIAEGLGAADGLAWDQFGRLFVSDWRGGRVFAIARPGDRPVLLARGFMNAADLIVDPGWSATGVLAVGREYHTATVLPSGKVVVIEIGRAHV